MGSRHWIAAVAAAALGLAGSKDVPEVDPPKSWSNFVILPWQYKTDAPRDRALYESVNPHGFHIHRRNDALQAFARETHWPYYLAHAAGKGYLHLGAAGDKISRKNDVVVRPNSLADPATMEAMKKLLQANVSAARGSS